MGTYRAGKGSDVRSAASHRDQFSMCPPVCAMLYLLAPLASPAVQSVCMMCVDTEVDKNKIYKKKRV